jgi:type IV secretion system protein TrbL
VAEQVGIVPVETPGPIGQKTDLVEGISDTFLDAAKTFNTELIEYAKDIFIVLAMIQLAWMAIRWVLGSKDAPSIVASLVIFFVQIGFFYALVLDPSWVKTIPDSFMEIGKGIAPIELNGSAIYDAGLKVSRGVTGTIAKTTLFDSWATAIIGTVTAIGIMMAFVMLGAQLVVAIIELAIVSNMSSMILMFAGFSMTRQVATHYIIYSIATGLKLLCMYIINAVAIGFANPWSEYLIENCSDGVEACLFTLGASFALAYIGYRVPRVTAGLAMGVPQLSGGGLFSDAFRVAQSPFRRVGVSGRGGAK